MWSTSDKDYILNTLNQVHIFSVFLNIPETEINNCIHIRNYKVSNPLRYDPNPSVGFKWYGSKLIMRDFADYKYRGDVFEIVGIVLKKNCTNNKDFVDICSAIIEYASDVINDTPYAHQRYQKGNIVNIDKFTTIRTINRDLTFYDRRFYNQYGIKDKYIKACVKAVSSFYIDGIKNTYYYTRTDPCYEYKVNANATKLYFPFRDKHTSNRFISNNKCPLENLDTVIISDYILITKSQKDKMLMWSILEDLGITNIGVYVISSETAKLPDDIVSLLKASARKGVYVMFDTDNTGLNSALAYKKDYGFKPLFFTKGYPAKDPTDLVKLTNYSFVMKKFANVYINDMINDKE